MTPIVPDDPTREVIIITTQGYLDSLHQRLREVEEGDRRLHDAYLRLRGMIPGAFDTPHAPSGEQVWATTEAALLKMLEKLAQAEQCVAALEAALKKIIAYQACGDECADVMQDTARAVLSLVSKAEQG